MRTRALLILGTLALAACSGGPGEESTTEGSSAILASPKPALQPLGSPPTVYVRNDGEADVVVMTPRNGALLYFHAMPGAPWVEQAHPIVGPGSGIAGPTAIASQPAIWVRSDNEADVVAQGSDNSLWYFYAFPGGSWVPHQISGPNTAFSAPAIVVRDSTGEADVVVEGANNSLWYYVATPGSDWAGTQIGGNGTAFSKPSITVRGSGDPYYPGEADVVVEGPGNSLLYSYLRAGTGQHWVADQSVAGPNTTFSAPSMFVRSAGGTAGEVDIVAQGLNNAIAYYHATPGAKWSAQPIPFEETISAPSIFVRGTEEADVVAQRSDGTLMYYWAFPGSAWASAPVSPAGEDQTAPSIYVRGPNQSYTASDNEADVVSETSLGQLHYYHATPGSQWADNIIPM